MHYQKHVAMKKIYAILALMLAAIGNGNAQVSINNDGTTPHPSAMLEIKSFNKGLLVPRSSSISISGIPSARNGLIAYDTTNERFRVRAGNSWYDMVDSRS
jgi:hypothetical protein